MIVELLQPGIYVFKVVSGVLLAALVQFHGYFLDNTLDGAPASAIIFTAPIQWEIKLQSIVDAWGTITSHLHEEFFFLFYKVRIHVQTSLILCYSKLIHRERVLANSRYNNKTKRKISITVTEIINVHRRIIGRCERNIKLDTSEIKKVTEMIQVHLNKINV